MTIMIENLDVLIVAILVLYLGELLTRKIQFLHSYNIPPSRVETSAVYWSPCCSNFAGAGLKPSRVERPITPYDITPTLTTYLNVNRYQAL